MYDELPQALLVSKAQQGDQEAFSTLIRQHRMKMLQWANHIVRNSVLAEDIVQEALILTLRRLGSLDHPDKFVPWLRSLVRNQSLMAIRAPSVRHEQLAYIDADVEDQMRHTVAINNDPQFQAIGMQALAEVERILDKLGTRERQVIQAHALEGLTVAETATRLGIHNGAVYTALSRARSKLYDYRFKEEIDRFMAAQRRNHQPESGQAANTRYDLHAGAYDTLCSMLMLAAAPAQLYGLTLSDMFAATGHAFRFHAACDLGISGPYCYDWKASVIVGLTHLGFSFAIYGGPTVQLQDPNVLIECMDEIRQSMSQGWPTVAWGLSNAEFGMIHGFDDQRQCWSVTDTSVKGKALPYDKLGRVRQPLEWFAAIPRRHLSINHHPHLAASILRLATRNIRGNDKVMQYSVSGAAAYRIWIDSFNAQQQVDPLSVAYNMAVVAEARHHAVVFMRHLLDGAWYGGYLPDSARLAVRHAASLFEQIAELLHRTSGLFPLPYGADPTSPGPADRAATLLERAAVLELEAAEVLEEAAMLIELHRS
ncbi:RNA polymerase sigma factor [Paenibacillus xylaniclasticus]|uniref:RNA polymerase sigma factor n=1 Tax=Paenibacillus xylaniclasticus TaxID=588083 RepID=UPI000FD78019|nr:MULTISPECIES: RNA polymerase sigma factor [Paenibacillus]